MDDSQHANECSYNSVFTQSAEANAYNTLFVTQDFLNGARVSDPSTDVVNDNIYGTPLEVMQQVQAEVHTYTELDLDDCSKRYSSAFVQDYSNLVIVSNVTHADAAAINGSVLASFYTFPNIAERIGNIFVQGSVPSDDFENSYGTPPIELQVNGSVVSLRAWSASAGDAQIEIPMKMDHCLAKPASNICTIELFPPYLETVIGANIVKMLCFIWILYSLPSLSPLITFGDAIASFLARPDPFTAGGRAISRDWVEKYHRQIASTMRQRGRLWRQHPKHREYKPWESRREPWIAAAGMNQRAFTYVA